MKLWLCVAGPQRAWGGGQGDNTIRVLAHHSQSTGALPQSTGRVLPEYCHSTARVLVQYPQSTGTTLPGTVSQYYQSTGSVLKEYWHSTPRALGECPSQSTDTAQKGPPPEYSQSEPTIVPEQPHCTDFSTVLVQSQTTKPTKKHQPATTQSTGNTEIDNVAPHTSKHRDSKHLHSAVKWP